MSVTKARNPLFELLPDLCANGPIELLNLSGILVYLQPIVIYQNCRKVGEIDAGLCLGKRLGSNTQLINLYEIMLPVCLVNHGHFIDNTYMVIIGWVSMMPIRRVGNLLRKGSECPFLACPATAIGNLERLVMADNVYIWKI